MLCVQCAGCRRHKAPTICVYCAVSGVQRAPCAGHAMCSVQSARGSFLLQNELRPEDSCSQTKSPGPSGASH